MNSNSIESNILCKFRHIFGTEKEGVHSLRILNIAIVDVVGTVLLAWFISNVFKLNFLHMIIIIIILSIIIHKIFCVETTFTKFIFKNN